MTQRRFAPRCGKCHQKTMAIATIPYSVQIDHDGKKYDVHVPSLSVPKCTNCGTISIDEVASDQIDTAFRRTAKLLTPSEIKNGRIRAGFQQQQEFAQVFGISVSTLSRWENGAQVQQRFHDGILRAFFEFAELRAFLASLHGVKNVLAGATISLTPRSVATSVTSLTTNTAFEHVQILPIQAHVPIVQGPYRTVAREEKTGQLAGVK